MNMVSCTLDLDADTDARLREMATERGQDIAEDRRRLDAFHRNGEAVPVDSVKRMGCELGK